MLNTKAKTFRIIDYKTGSIQKEEQAGFYQSIIKNILPPDYSPEQDAGYIYIDL